MAGSTPRFNGDLDGFVEFPWPVLDHLHRLIEGVELFPIDALPASKRASRGDMRLTPSPQDPSSGRSLDHPHWQIDGITVESFIFARDLFTSPRVTAPLYHGRGLGARLDVGRLLKKKEPRVFIANVKERSP